MKVPAILCAATLAVFGLASQASAYSLNPKSSGTIVITGPTNLTAFGTTVPCTSQFTGSIDSSGVGSITSATFSGGGLCGFVRAQSLPWGINATNPTDVTISNVKVSVFGLVTCGPGSVGGSLVGSQPTTSVSFSGTIGSCSVSSNPTVTSNTALSISNP